MLKAINVVMAEENRPETSKQITLQRLGKKISKHFVSGTVHNRNTLRLDSIFDKKISDVDMARLLACRCSTILFKMYSTLIVLR